MKQYEVTFIVDPVLSGDEIKTTAKAYEDLLKDSGATLVNVDDLGLKQLAYQIKRRTTGIYYVVEYKIKYNEDKRNGLIGKKRDKVKEEIKEAVKAEAPKKAQTPPPAPAPAAAEEE